MESEIQDSRVDAIQKKLIAYYLISFVIIFLFNGIWEYYLNLKLGALFNLIAIAIIVQNALLIKSAKFNFNHLVNLASVAVTMYYYIRVLMYWQMFPIIYFSILQMPLATIFVNSIKTTIAFTVIILFLILTAPFASNFFNLTYNISITKSQYTIMNYSIIIFSSYITLLALYFLNQLNRQKILIQSKSVNLNQKINIETTSEATIIPNKENDESLINDKELDISENKEIYDEDMLDEGIDNINEENHKSIILNEEKINVLFIEIENFMNNEQPFKDPDFNAKLLASKLNTNITYISKVLSSKKKMNFKTYINTYRVEHVKEKLKNKEHERFNLKYIYNDSGFSYQSTFNRVFKEIEGVTPTEYIEKLN